MAKKSQSKSFGFGISGDSALVSRNSNSQINTKNIMKYKKTIKHAFWAYTFASTLQLNAATRYWDTTAGAGNGVGGSGTWAATSTNIFSADATGSASLTTASSTDDIIFQGTAGVVTLGASFTALSFTFNTTGYALTTASTTARALTGSITLANNVNLTIGSNASTADRTVGIGSLSGGTSSALTLNSSATGSNHLRLNIASSSATIGVPITVTGTGFTAIVGTATGTQVTSTITGNGERLNLGATSGNALTISNTIDNGTGNVRIAAGSTGGAGVLTLSGTGNTWGATELNNSTTGILRMGVLNALPSATTLTFGFSTGNGASNVELNGFNTTIGQLTNTVVAGGILRNTNASDATLTISGSDSSAAAFSGALQDGTGGGKLNLARNGTGTTILSGSSNTFTGTTSIGSGATLALTGTGSIATTSSITVNGTLDISGLTSATPSLVPTLAGAGTINATGKTLSISGAVAPSDMNDPLNITGNAVRVGGTAWQFNLSGSDNKSDQLAVSGSLNKSGSGFVFDFMGATPTYGTVFTLATFGSSDFVVGDFDIAASRATLGSGPYSTSFFTVNPTSLQFTAVPEASNLLIGGLVGLGLLSRRRKQA